MKRKRLGRIVRRIRLHVRGAAQASALGNGQNDTGYFTSVDHFLWPARKELKRLARLLSKGGG